MNTVDTTVNDGEERKGGCYPVPPVQNTGADPREDEAPAAEAPAPAPEAPAAPAAPDVPPAPTEPVAPTPEEQAEIDAMVDYTITEETLEQFNAARAEGMEPFKVGDQVKLAPNHPLVAPAATPEGGAPQA